MLLRGDFAPDGAELIVQTPKHRRDFGAWSDALGMRFCTQLAEAYSSFYSDNAKTEVTYWHRITSFFDYLARSPAQEGLRDFLRTGVITTSGVAGIEVLFHGALSGYRENLLNDDSIKNRTKFNNVAAVSVFVCRHLADHGVVPQGLRIKTFQFIDEVGPSLLAVSLTSKDASDKIANTVKAFIGDSETEATAELDSLLENILAEAQSIKSNDLVDSSITVLNRRISLIKNHTAAHIVARIKEINEAAEWVLDPAIRRRAESLKQLFDNPITGGRQRGEDYAVLLAERPLPVIVVFCKLYTGGIYPIDGAQYSAQLTIRISRFLNQDYSSVRRRLGMDAMDIAHCSAWLMLEHAMNSSSAISLKVDCLASVGEGIHSLSWTKPRAGSDNLFTALIAERPATKALTADVLTSVDIIQFAIEAGENYRAMAATGHDKNLFLHFYKCGPVPRTPHTDVINLIFKEVCLAATEGRWVANINTLRASVLILEALVSRNPFAVQQKAGHKSLSMAKKYVYQLPEILRRDKNIRDFLDWFETLLTVDIDGFADKVGIDSADYEKRKLLINQQFGGIHCKDPLAGVQEGTKPGEVCDRVESCVTCVNRRNIFLFTNENVINVIQWDQALSKGKGRLPDTEFDNRWGIWRLFTSSILRGIQLDPMHQLLYKSALEESERLANPYHAIFSEQAITESGDE